MSLSAFLHRVCSEPMSLAPILFSKLWLNQKKKDYIQVWRGSSTPDCNSCPFLKVSERKSNNLCKIWDKHNYGLHHFELLRRTDSWTAPPLCRTAPTVVNCVYPAWLWGHPGIFLFTVIQGVRLAGYQHDTKYTVELINQNINVLAFKIKILYS